MSSRLNSKNAAFAVPPDLFSAHRRCDGRRPAHGLAACGGDSSDDSNKGPVKFAVLSDTHFFDTAALGDSAGAGRLSAAGPQDDQGERRELMRRSPTSRARA